MDAANNQRWMDNPNRNCATPPDAEPDDVNNHAEQWFPLGHGNDQRAKALCDDCPVKNACLTWALTDKTEFGYPGGILGGTTEDERAVLRNDTPLPSQLRDSCGSMTGNSAHRRNKERICDDCREAWNAYRREWRRKRAESAA